MAFTHTTSECARLLRTSTKALRQWRCEGYLKPGEHFRALGPGRIRPSLIWDPEATEAALARRTKKVLGA
jgi:hypothetical protein